MELLLVIPHQAHKAASSILVYMRISQFIQEKVNVDNNGCNIEVLF